MEKIVLLGGGGHCSSIIDTIQNSNLYEIVGIIDLKKNIGQNISGVKVIDSDENLIKYKKVGIENVFISVGSIGNPYNRIKLFNLAKAIGFKIPSIVDNSAIVSKNAKIGYGTFVGKGVIINTGSIIGCSCIVNSGSIIEHDCVIGEFVHISPGSILCGGVKIGKFTHIGANSTVIQYRNIGENTVIGAGSLVLKDIRSNITAYGSPCKELF
ncbi:acetyltransferase [Clostridium beijerinckii]|uniref:acetyltransferase n=1 Tax=Clostridium beijerinckii TaxID=1520 RepID=UPI001A9A8368|nr:acetyltransferase [Clostridium beijerinckii]NRT73697.1 sugar O-acyltransferase (sialic acid O-acetyltransferase NeuD family) [Clostridium beijerinckii]